MAVTITSTVTAGYDFASGETITPAKLDLGANPTCATSVTLATDKLLARTSASTGAVEEADFTDVAQTLLAQTTQAAMRTTGLGCGTIATQSASAASLAMDVCHINNDTLSYAATTDIDMSSTSKTCQTVTLTGNITFTTSGKASGRTKLLRIVGDGSSRSLTFPSWVFVGDSAPVAIAANKTAMLTLVCFGTADTDIIASYVVQS